MCIYVDVPPHYILFAIRCGLYVSDHRRTWPDRELPRMHPSLEPEQPSPTPPSEVGLYGPTDFPMGPWCPFRGLLRGI